MVCFSHVFAWALVGAPFLVAAQPGGEQGGDMMEMLEDNTTMVEIMDNMTTTEPAPIEATSPSQAPTSSQGPVMMIDDLPLMTVDEIVLSDPDTTTLAAAFKASGLLGVLCENCNYTVFA